MVFFIFVIQSSHWVATVLLGCCKVIERPSKKEGFCFKLVNTTIFYLAPLVGCFDNIQSILPVKCKRPAMGCSRDFFLFLQNQIQGMH